MGDTPGGHAWGTPGVARRLTRGREGLARSHSGHEWAQERTSITTPISPTPTVVPLRR